ncbi:MAG: hypothetical protein GX999_06720, partial [Bacteroidales bacterium]|nr:hypothetical protein [Bacteroidales bacterium]
VIYWCNLILERIPESDNATIKRVKAEADFIRALCMFELVRWFGTPPFVDHVLSTDEYNMPNGDPAVIIPWCLERMQSAADALPALSGIGQQEAYGARISKHGALAYKGKVALWYGTRYNDAEILGQAVEPLKTVVNSNLYGLVDDYITDCKHLICHVGNIDFVCDLHLTFIIHIGAVNRSGGKCLSINFSSNLSF